jgi:hypothetical protein
VCYRITDFRYDLTLLLQDADARQRRSGFTKWRTLNALLANRVLEPRNYDPAALAPRFSI